MYIRLRLLLAFCCFGLGASAQMDLSRGWTFRTGDDPSWTGPNVGDSNWKPIEVGKQWEVQGYTGYDGYAWYRLHINIPSALKDSSFLKESLRFDLGKIDDGDQVFLNGKLIGQNAGKTNDITQGQYDLERIYTVPLDDASIHWNQDNVIAVRVYDHGGDGGMYDGRYTLAASDVTDFVTIDYQSYQFKFRTPHLVRKNIALKSTDSRYVFSGTLTITAEDPSTGTILSQKNIPVASFSPSEPFRYVYALKLPAQQSYVVLYTFKDRKSRKEVTASEGIPYILTPAAPATPRINGAEVFGVRPLHPVIIKVPATGAQPLTYSATNLPLGLSIHPTSGVISGRVREKGTYRIHVWATNHLGKSERDLTIIVGDQIALTPALGWNSWNCWGLSVSDAKVKGAADAMKRSGLINHGWTYINMDDGWERETRDGKGDIVPNSKFPDMAAMTAYVHSLGLKVGIYSSPGPRTCGGYLGSYQHEAQDAKTYAKWGIDYLKYDWCSYGELYPKPTLDELKKPYEVMRSALNEANRDILFSLCQYGMGDVWKWGGDIGGNSWRTTGDINDSWGSMSSIGFRQDVCTPYTRPGNWNDPDMLVVGKVGWGPSLHYTRLTPDEQYTHISLWCMLSAPLLIGCDMTQMDDFTLNLLSNDEVLAIDQDPAAKPARKASVQGDIQVWTKPLADGTVAVGIFNLGNRATVGTFSFSDLGLDGDWQVRDCWRQKDQGTFNGNYTSRPIPSHGVVLLRLRRRR
jgi:alpha-galactosidase